MKKLLWLSFGFTFTVKSRIRRKFTDAGLFVLIISFVSAVFGINTDISLHYQIFTFSLSLLLFAWVLSRGFRPQIELKRILPEFTTVNETAFYQVQIKNISPKPLRGLIFLEQLPDPRPDFHSFINTQEPWDASPNRFDRFFTYPRWQWLIAKNRMARVHEHKIPDLAVGEQVEINIELTPLRRGNIRFADFLLIKPDPFGLVKAYKRFKLEQSVISLPKRYPLPAVSLPGNQRYQSGGVSQAGSVGEAEEFVSLRDYRPEDSPRRLHWKAWAKTGKPIVKEYQQEYFVRHALVLDTFSKNYFDPSFEQAVSVAASFVCSVQTQESLLDLIFVGDQAYRFTAGQGLLHTNRMLEILASVSTCPNKDFDYLGHQILSHSSQLSGCICVFLDWDDKRRSMIDQLNSLGIHTRVFVIRDSQQKPSIEPIDEYAIKLMDVAQVSQELGIA